MGRDVPRRATSWILFARLPLGATFAYFLGTAVCAEFWRSPAPAPCQKGSLYSTHRGRRIALGFVPDDRFVLASFEYDKKTRWVRVVTAYEAEHERWWEIYAKAKKLDP